MATINTYLYFNGNCAEAFDFYKSVFGGEFQYVGKFTDKFGINWMVNHDINPAEK